MGFQISGGRFVPDSTSVVAPGVQSPGSTLMSVQLVNDAPGIGRAGQVITQAVTPADVGDVTERLANYLGGYKQDDSYGADMASRIVLVDKEAGTRRDRSAVNAYQPVDDVTGREGSIREIEDLSVVMPYKCEEHALAAWISWQAQNDADQAYDVRAHHARTIQNKLLLNREIRIWNHLTTVANWNAANQTTLLAAQKWNVGTGNPLLDIQTRLDASLQRVTAIYMNPTIAYWFLQNAAVQALARATMGDNAPKPSAIQNATSVQTLNLPAIPPIHIIPSKQMANELATPSYILGDDVVLSTEENGFLTNGESVVTHVTFRVRGPSGNGITVREYQPANRGVNSGTMSVSGFSECHFFPSNRAGGLIHDVL